MDKKALLTDRMSGRTEKVEIPGVGEIVVRGLSRYEMFQAFKLEGELNQEAYILSKAILDPSGLTEDDIAEWQKASPPGEINAVATVINTLSGIGEGAGKS